MCVSLWVSMGLTVGLHSNELYVCLLCECACAWCVGVFSLHFFLIRHDRGDRSRRPSACPPREGDPSLNARLLRGAPPNVLWCSTSTDCISLVWRSGWITRYSPDYALFHTRWTIKWSKKSAFFNFYSSVRIQTSYLFYSFSSFHILIHKPGKKATMTPTPITILFTVDQEWGKK